MNKKYWNSLDQLNGDESFVKNSQKEFAEQIPVDEFLNKPEITESGTSRRDFMKFLGFSLSAATLAACETPVVKSIPYLVKPESITPGVPNYYASTYFDGLDYCSILVKTREGRPIHIEGNKLSGVTKGGVNARVNSSVLGLYDTKRLQNPMVDGAQSTWGELDDKVIKHLEGVKANGGSIRVLTPTVISPSALAVIQQLSSTYTSEVSDVKHVQYDSLSASAILEANKSDFGKAVIPQYNFAKANVIVGIGADFLSNWLSSIEYSKDYAVNRVPSKKGMSKHYQFEGTLSLTGSNADIRGAVRPSEYGNVAVALYNEIAKKAGVAQVGAKSFEDDNSVTSKISDAANQLWANKGKSLVVCGSNDSNTQIVINAINTMLQNYNATIDVNNYSNIRKGVDSEFISLTEELNSGSVSALIVMGCDPVYSAPSSLNFAGAMSKAKLTVGINDMPNSTTDICSVVASSHHYLESWNDAQITAGELSLTQPSIKNLFNTRQAEASLLKWSGLGSDYYNYIKSYWNDVVFSQQSEDLFFDSYWNNAVHNGVVKTTVAAGASEGFVSTSDINVSAAKAVGSANGWEVELYSETAMGDGRQANNPWLQELPHPVTKVVWDNYITMNPADMEGTYEVRTGQETPANLASVSVNGNNVTLPVVALPGQKKGTIGIALGYGKGKVNDELIGSNAFPMLSVLEGTINYFAQGVSVEKAEGTYAIASTQTHHTMMGRKIVNETSLDTFLSKGKEDWNETAALANAYGEKTGISKLDLWQEHPIENGHRWGMSVDLNACIGCGSCVTACHSENNVPVVGKDEVRRTRTMSWMRIDRYFSSDADPKRNNGEKAYLDMEIPSDYPEVVFQPLMCQHCNHAPCETVCPVAATTHSNEGLNQMAYNRCVGTRYCANNCPFKVRRFNWFNYTNDFKFDGINPSQDDMSRLVLNPDVVVRSRGVMEKCSMCVQRIQAGKLDAKKKGTAVQNGAIQTACSSSCPTNAIQFGDLNDEAHDVYAMKSDDRAYNMLEEIGVKPNIYYQTKVRNKPEAVASVAETSEG